MAAFFYTLATMKLAHAKDQLQAAEKDRGATAVEYGIMVAAIAAVIIAIVFAIGGKIKTAFETVNTNLTT